MKKNILQILCLFLPAISFSQTEGDAFFSTPQVHEIRFTFYQTAYWDSLVAGYTGDYYINGDVEIDGTLLTNCGLKMKGNSSYNNPGIKKSFKIDFNNYVSGQKYDGLKKLNLNNGFKDPSFLREKLMLDFLNENNAYAPRCHYANLYINDTLWGLYTVVDEIDKTFLNRVFGDKKGNLFKGDPNGDLRWLGSAQSNYESKYELKTNEITNNWSDLIALINTLNNSPVANLDQSLDTLFDFDNYSISWAAHNLFANLDSYLGSGHNYYVYFDSTALKFRFINWDVNEAFGNFNMGMSITQLEQMNITYSSGAPGSRPLTENCLQNNPYFGLYRTRICDLLQYNFSIYGLDAKIDSLANLIRLSVYADPNKFYSNQNFEDNIIGDVTISGNPGGGTMPGIKSFIINRRNALSIQTAGFCTVSVNVEKQEMEIEIFPNPANDLVYITGSGNDYSYEIITILGKKIDSGKLNEGINSVNISWLSAGIYIFNVQNVNTGLTFTKKLIKK